MIPQISQAPGVVQLVLNFLQVLEQQGFTGDTATSYADRLTMATDNSVYQLLPDAILFPRSTADVALLARLAAEERFKTLIFTPRGGGTGTNGQALNAGIIVDMSRYMNRIIEINPEEGWVRVEAGVIKDQLNQFLKPYGYFFAPELSTSNRATLGGMINTDASGQGSLVYGKTSDHVLGVRSVLIGGDILDTQPIPAALAETLGAEQSAIGRIYRTVYQRCKAQRQLVIDKFPKLNRFLTGYDLRHVFNDDMSEFDLTRILTGSKARWRLLPKRGWISPVCRKCAGWSTLSTIPLTLRCATRRLWWKRRRFRSKRSTRRCSIWRGRILSGIRLASSLPTLRIRRCWG